MLPVLCLCLLSLCACGESNLDKLHGKWQMDIGEMLKDPSLDKNEFSQSIARAMLEAMNITLDIDAKGKQITLFMGEMQEKESFTVVSDSGKELVLKTVGSGENRRFEFKDQDTVLMSDDADRTVILKRRK
jgi:hypothetical protein